MIYFIGFAVSYLAIRNFSLIWDSDSKWNASRRVEACIFSLLSWFFIAGTLIVLILNMFIDYAESSPGKFKIRL